MDRRTFLQAGAGLALAAPALRLPGARAALADPLDTLVPIRASVDRMVRITVCLRPFRAAGPRIEAEEVGRKRVVHNYGHGGSGWSLSWGSAELAVGMAMADGARDLAIIGAGAIGLTTALTAQRRGAAVTIYAREQFPHVRSARATGSWTPDSRIALAGHVDAGFEARWEAMARASFAMHQSYLGLAGDPVEWVDRYSLSDLAPGAPDPAPPPTPPPVQAEPPAREFLYLERRLLSDITPRLVPVTGPHPFAAASVRRGSVMTFNVADLAHQLTADFLLAGGRIVPMDFATPADIARLKQKVVVDCTGYGARALWRDESVVPVRGQIAWLIPQQGATYGLYKDGLNMLARRDGIVVQELGPDDWFGYGDDDETPDRAAAVASIEKLASFWATAAGQSPKTS